MRGRRRQNCTDPGVEGGTQHPVKIGFWVSSRVLSIGVKIRDIPCNLMSPSGAPR